MNTAIRYRHNPGAIRSLEDFLRAHGGYAEGQREVYFLRALGALPNMAAAVQDMDRLGGPTYLRLPEALPKLTSPEDTAFYTGAYEAWRAGGPLRLHLNCRDPLFPQVLAQATEDTLAQLPTRQGRGLGDHFEKFRCKAVALDRQLAGGPPLPMVAPGQSKSSGGERPEGTALPVLLPAHPPGLRRITAEHPGGSPGGGRAEKD